MTTPVTDRKYQLALAESNVSLIYLLLMVSNICIDQILNAINASRYVQTVSCSFAEL